MYVMKSVEDFNIWSYISETVSQSDASKAQTFFNLGYKTAYSAALKSIASNEGNVRQLLCNRKQLQFLTAIVLQARQDLLEQEVLTPACNPVLSVSDWRTILIEVMHLCSSTLHYVENSIDNTYVKISQEAHSFCQIVSDTLWLVWNMKENRLLEEFITDLTTEVSFVWMNIKDADFTDQHALLQNVMASLASVLQKMNEKGTLSSVLIDKMQKLVGLSLEVLKRGEPTSTAFTIVHFFPVISKQLEATTNVRQIWDTVVGFYEEKNDDFYERKPTGLTILCSLWDMCYPDSKTIALLPLHGKETFWRIIQFGLTHVNLVHRKRAMFLLKRVLDYQKSNDETVCVLNSNGDSVFHWEPAQSDVMIWEDLLILLEVLEEKQVHIIKPLLSKVDGIMKAVFTSCCDGSVLRIDVNWLLLLFKRMIMHENKFTARWALTAVLKFKAQETPHAETAIIRFFTFHFLPFLNDPDIFARVVEGKLGACPPIGEALVTFLCHLQQMNGNFISALVHRVAEQSWSGVALFYVTRALAEIPVTSSLGGRELECLREILVDTQSSQEQLIRGAIQCNIMKVVLNLVNQSEVSFSKLSRFLTTLKRNESFNRSTTLWWETVAWMANMLHLSSKNGNLLSSSCAQSFCAVISKTLLQDESESTADNHDNDCLRTARMVLLLDDAARSQISSANDDIISAVRKNLDRVVDVIVTAPLRPYILSWKLDWALQLCTCIVTEGEETKYIFTVPGQDLVQHLELQFLPHMETVASFLIERLLTSKTTGELTVYSGAIKALFSMPKLRFSFMSCIPKLLEPLSSTPLEILCCWTCFEIFSSALQPEDLKRIICLQKLNLLLETPKGLGSPEEKKIASIAIASAWKCIYHYLEYFPLHDVNRSDDLVDLAMRTFEIVSLQGIVCVLHSLKHIVLKCSKLNLEPCLEASWKACMELRKNEHFRPALQAFISVVFQPVLMETQMAYLLEKIRALHMLGETSTGTFNLLVKQCTSVWLDGLHMSTVANYVTLLCDACIFGPVHRKDQRIVQNTSAFISDQERLSVNELIKSDHHADHEVRVLAISYLLSLSPNDPCHQSLISCLVSQLLKKEMEITSSRTRHFANSLIHRVKTRIWQVMLLLEPFMTEPKREEVLMYVYESLMQENQQPSVRYFLEWIAVLILEKQPHILESFPDVLVKAGGQRVGCVASFLAILVHLTYICCKNDLEKRLNQWIPLVLPWCMTQHFNTRVYAQVALRKLWNIAEERQPNILDNFGILKQCLGTSDSTGNAAKACKQLSEDFYFTVFHPIRHYTLETIFYDLPRLSNLTDEDWIPVSLFDQSMPISKCKNSSLLRLNVETPLRDVQPSTWVLRDAGAQETEMENFQRKIMPWKMMIPDVEAMEESTKKVVKMGGLIVVASLIDRAPNLGGLCRTCEVFGVSIYVVGSLKYTEDQQFRNLSVSSERWINIKEVKPHQLKEYLLEMKNQDYTLVGVEQTANSQNLIQYKFPERTLMLLGNEKEGIPIELLHLLDVCVEIPQQGVIRSLNVHVSGALLIWEYTKQHTNA